MDEKKEMSNEYSRFFEEVQKSQQKTSKRTHFLFGIIGTIVATQKKVKELEELKKQVEISSGLNEHEKEELKDIITRTISSNRKTIKNRILVIVAIVIFLIVVMSNGGSNSNNSSSSNSSSSSSSSGPKGEPWKELGVSKKEYMEIYNKIKYGE